MKSACFIPAVATGASLLLLAAARPAATPCHDYLPSSAVQSWLALMGSKTDVVIAGQQVYVATNVQRLYGVSFADPGAIEQTWSF